MKRLNIKMLRDIKKNLSQFITIFLMVFIGVMAYSGIEAYMDGMEKTANKYYKENNLQDLNVLGANFTEEDLEQIKEIENVKNAERKLSLTGTTDGDKTLLLNFIETNNISKFYVFEGEEFNPSIEGVWVDKYYAEENGLKIDDEITVKYDKIELKEKIKGIVNIPDHVYDVKDASELYPDHKEFGVAYLSAKKLPEQFRIFNSVMVDVENENNKNQVKNKIEEKIENAVAVTDIKDSISYVTYQGEIDEGKTYIGVFSGLFLFIAMLSVITTMTRVVKKQRVQIGTLKALGFKKGKILLHYISYGFWISLVASLVGLVAGYYLIGNFFISMEMAFFEMPNGMPTMNNSCYVVALLVVLVVSFITYLTCRKILKENTAETLRSKLPNVKNKSLNITTKGIFKNLGFSSKWNLRDIIRNKMRTFMGVVGVTGCAMLIVCAFGMFDSMNYFVELQFEKLYNFDYKLVLKENISEKNIQELEDKYGKSTSKTFGIEIKNGDTKEANNAFITDAKDYIRFVNKNGEFINVNSEEGIYVTHKLAETKGYKIGDEISWHIYGNNTYYTSKIIGFNKDPQNQNITMTRKYLESLGVKYIPDSLYTNQDLSKIKEIDNVEIIQNKNALKEGMNNMLQTMRKMIILIIVIAILLGAIIIYNLGILSYTEKQYQFSTLKVLGFKNKKIKNIFIKQNNWIAIVSIILGIPLGYYLTDWLFKTAIEEHYDFGASIQTITYVIAAVGTFTVSYLVSKILARKVKNIDMVSSLKGNE